MKTAALVLLAFAAVAVSSVLLGQATAGPPSERASEMTLLSGSTSNLLFVPELSSALPVVPTNSSSRIAGPKSPRVLRLRPIRPDGQLEPGIYEAAPFTCIVVVPGRHLDDKMIVGGQSLAGTNVFVPRMPMVRPELRFIPRGRR